MKLNNSTNTQEEKIKKPEVAIEFKGSIKRRLWQYTDTFVNILIIIAAFLGLDYGVDLLYKHKIADTQSAAQYFTVQDVEGILLAFLVLALCYNVINLLLEVTFDSIHWFRETDKDKSWTAHKAFQQLSPWQQWLIYVILFASSLLAFPQILQGLT